MKLKKKRLTSARIIIGGFMGVILIGAFLLMLPISSKSGAVTPFINALFTSTSAVCVTGLVVYDTATYWTWFGQFVILLLIQIGGMGVVTIALSLMSIVLIEVSGVRAKGMKGWLKSFTQPIAVVTPINILELVTRPLSLCMRLFGNVLGAFVIMELIKMVVPVFVPMVFSLYFDFFDGLIQAYVFVFLTSLFIAEATEV